jgi:hypothetical protein
MPLNQKQQEEQNTKAEANQNQVDPPIVQADTSHSRRVVIAPEIEAESSEAEKHKKQT